MSFQDFSKYLENVVGKLAGGFPLTIDETAKEAKYTANGDPESVLSQYFNTVNVVSKPITLENGVTAYYFSARFINPKYKGSLTYRLFFELDLGDEFLIFVSGHLNVVVPTSVYVAFVQNNGESHIAKTTHSYFCTSTKANGEIQYITQPGQLNGFFTARKVQMYIGNYRNLSMAYGNVEMFLIPIKKTSDAEWLII